MRAIFRYLYLKSRRDHSLVAFVFTPVFVPLAAVLGVTISKGHLRYPFFLNDQYTPSQNAALAMLIASIMAVLFANIATFWTLRAEIATSSINAFVFGVRPSTIIIALILFGSVMGVVSAAGATGMVWVLTTSLPPKLGLLALKLPLGFIAGSAIGAFVVTLSPQPAMMVCSYIGCLILVPFVEKEPVPVQFVVLSSVAIVCTALAVFLLRRRCAT